MHGSSQRRVFAGLCLLLIWQSGCAAFRPVHGVPARYLPEEMKVGDRSARRTIDLSLLRQPPPRAHLIDSGDVLGIYVEGFVGKATDPPPVHFPLNNESAPSFGLPYPVREDGTISLPVIGSIPVRGLTLVQAEERVKQAYLSPRQLIRPDFNRVQVNLQRPRQFRVLVIRQDSRNEPASTESMGQINMGLIRRGTGKVVNLPVYSNDVLNALTATDGLPGLDAENAVYVIRHRGTPGGGGDPRWPVNVDPHLLLHPSGSLAPVVRGQSPDPGYAGNGADVYHANYIGMPSPPVQYVGGQPPLAPAPVWDSRGALPSPADPNWVGHSPYPEAGPQGSVPGIPNGFQPALNAPAAAEGYGPPPAYGQPPAYGPPPAYGAPPAYGPPASYGFPTNAGDAAGGPAMPGHGSQPYPPQPPTLPDPVGRDADPLDPNSPPPLSSGLHSLPPVDPRSVPMLPSLSSAPLDGSPTLETGHGVLGGGMLDGRHVIRIPIRLGPGETADIRPEDILLYDGDIVFIESRETEVFYTGGLLGGGQYTLPRDYDLDIMQAISLATARGPTGSSRAVGGVSALNNDVSISPSTAIVLRKLPDGGEVPVKVDLYRARTDISERIVIQPGDFILLQYTPLEAVAAFFERHLLETALFAVAAQAFNNNGSGGGN